MRQDVHGERESESRKKQGAGIGWGWGLSEPRGWVRLQMYTQCSGAQAKGWRTECCCFSRAVCFSSLCALFCWMPRAAIHRRCLSSSRTHALSHPTSSIRTAPVLMSPKKKQHPGHRNSTRVLLSFSLWCYLSLGLVKRFHAAGLV